MTATAQDFTLFQGDDTVLAFLIKDAEGAALDLTGATIAWAMAPLPLADPPGGLTAAGSVSDAAAGACEVALAGADTVSLAPGRYQHELDVIDAGGRRSTVATGYVTLRRAILK